MRVNSDIFGSTIYEEAWFVPLIIVINHNAAMRSTYGTYLHAPHSIVSALLWMMPLDKCSLFVLVLAVVCTIRTGLVCFKPLARKVHEENAQITNLLLAGLVPW